MDPILGMVDHAIKLHVRRRVTKEKADETFGDEDFDKQLEALESETCENIEHVNGNANTNNCENSENATNNIDYNNINENNNENNNEVVDEQPKKRKGRPKKVPGALAE
jgi:hypothetical protein